MEHLVLSLSEQEIAWVTSGVQGCGENTDFGLQMMSETYLFVVKSSKKKFSRS